MPKNQDDVPSQPAEGEAVVVDAAADKQAAKEAEAAAAKQAEHDDFVAEHRFTPERAEAVREARARTQRAVAESEPLPTLSVPETTGADAVGDAFDAAGYLGGGMTDGKVPTVDDVIDYANEHPEHEAAILEAERAKGSDARKGVLDALS